MKPIPLFLLPGTMCNHLLWADQTAEFSSERDVLVANFVRADTIEEMASNALSQISGDFVLAGLSMGGIVAFEMWKQAPERIKGLAILDANPKADTDEKREMRRRQIRDARQGLLDRILIEELKPNYVAPIHRTDRLLLSRIMAMADDLGGAVFERQSRALMARSDYTGVLETITCPVEVLCGKDDVLCPTELHRKMAALIPDARLTVLPDCGHMSSMEAPSLVNNILRDLIKRVEAGH